MMMAVTVCRASAPSGIITSVEHADNPDHVAGASRSFPWLRGLVALLRKAVVQRPHETVAAVQAPRLQELFRPDHAERVEKLGANDVLAALAATERQVRHRRVIASRSACQDAESSSSGCAPVWRTLAVVCGAGRLRGTPPAPVLINSRTCAWAQVPRSTTCASRRARMG